MNTTKQIFRLTFLSCLLFSRTEVHATILTVSNSMSAPAQYNDLQTAVDSASVGDTLLVTGTGSSYGNITIDKPLMLVGAGYAPAGLATIVQGLDIRSSNVSVTGFLVTSSPFNSIKLNAFNTPGQSLANVRISRCMGGIDLRGSNTLGSGLFSDVVVGECIITAVNFANGFAENRFRFDTLVFANNIFNVRFAPNPNGGMIDDYIGTETIIIDHNDFLGNGNNWGAFWTQYQFSPGAAWAVGEMMVSNNIFQGTGPRGCPNCCFVNNMTFGAGPEDSDSVATLVCGSGNYWNVDPGITPGLFNLNNNYNPPLGSLALGNASDGTDIGITGGLYALVVGAPPSGPKVDMLNVDESAVPPDSMFHYQVLAHAFQTPGIQLDSLEYLFDVDAGIGTGTTVAFPPTSSLDLIAEAYALGLDSGAHILGVRVCDQSGAWSASKWTDLSICNTYGPSAAFTLYRSGRSVSFVDHSSFATSIEYDFGDGQVDTDWNPYHTYAEAGLYTVAQIVSSPCGLDTALQIASISGLNAYQPRKASNAGFCTMTLSGAGFTAGMDFRLTRSGSPDLLPISVVVLSESSALAELDLMDATEGHWNLELIIPDDTTQIILNGFEIVSSAALQPIVCTVTGPPIIRTSTWTTFNVDVHNPNGNDVFAVPVWMAIPADIDFEMITPVDVPVFPGSDTLASQFDTDSLWSEPYNGTVYPVVISRIPAYSSVTVSYRGFTAASTGAGDHFAWAEKPLFGTVGDTTGLDQPYGSAPSAGSPWGCVSCLMGFVPYWSCATGAAGVLSDVAEYAQGNEGPARAREWGQTALKLAVDCGAGPSSTILKYLKRLKKSAGFGDCVAKECMPMLAGPKRTSYGCACDPNAKYGPFGISSVNYISANEELSYIITFENLDSSLFAAQRIVIIDTLDSSVLDIANARLGSIGLADSLVYDGIGALYASRVIPLSSGFNLRVNAEIDTVSGIVQWELFMVDPADESTPIDPLVGFLPPNITSPEGQGFATLRVPLKVGLPHDQVIENRATIVFDNNEAIHTGTWLNTLDTIAPTSAVLPMNPTTVEPTVVVDLDGGDSGSGIEWFEVYVRADTSAVYLLWVVTDSAAAIFTGTDGFSYDFYSIAVDSVGNREIKAPTSEGQTFFDFETALEEALQPPPLVQFFPNPTSGRVQLSGDDLNCLEVDIEVQDVVGKIMMRQVLPTRLGTIRETIDLGSFAPGGYLAIVRCGEAKVTERLVRLTE